MGIGPCNELHRRGVAHFELKRKANLIAQPGSLPGIIDFGLAVIRKPGFAQFNHFLYRLAVQVDFNAWIKHKYRKRLIDVSPADRGYYRRTRVEKIWSLAQETVQGCEVARPVFRQILTEAGDEELICTGERMPALMCPMIQRVWNPAVCGLCLSN